MTDPVTPDRPDELDTAAEQASIASARRHVGAAGFAQRDVLEQIITAGREQLAVTQSLRQVMASTQTQLRATPLTGAEEGAHPHRAALEAILTSGRAQLETASELRRAIQTTLVNVRGTPLEDVSANVLTALSQVVRRQEADLAAIIATALGEASTVEQTARLERVSAEATARAIHTEHERAERELAHLDLLGTQALDRIRSLEAHGQAHAEQKAQLEQEARASLKNISALEAEETRALLEIGRMEQQNEVSSARIEQLEAAAVQLRERVGGLHRELEQAGSAAETQANPQE